MSRLYIYATQDDIKASEKRAYLEAKGYAVTVYGKSSKLRVDSQELDDGSLSSGNNAWVLVGEIDH